MNSRKNRFFAIAAGVLCALLLTGCASQPFTQTVFAMDTVCEITAYGRYAEAAVASCAAELSQMERELSATGDGGVASINAGAGSAVAASEDVRGLIGMSKDAAALTGGAFDITVYPIVCAWGFPTDEYRVPEPDELAELLELTGSDRIAIDDAAGTVTIEPGMTIDLGGIAKGWAGQRLTELMRDGGVTSGIVTLGGNVQTLGKKPDGTDWRIGLRDPSGGVYATIDAADEAVVTSGGYIRYFEQDGVTYHHIIDPHTGYPAASGLTSVTVVSGSGELADVLSTAFFVMGEAAAQQFYADGAADGSGKSWEFEAVFVSESGKVSATPGIAQRVQPYGDGGGYAFDLEPGDR